MSLGFRTEQFSAQTPGQWTWMHGMNTGNQAGTWGTMGVAAAANMPPSVYEACQWTDLQGNFWLFGGYGNGLYYNALWKFDPVIKQWAWMNGPQTGNGSGVYGVQGVAAPANIPGARGFGMLSWTDRNGKFWLFGGLGYDASGLTTSLGDLWKFDPVTMQWTWMSGGAVSGGVFGIQGVAAASNVPPTTTENHCCWVDASNNLWFYGGYSGSAAGVSDNMWKYDIGNGMWTWMNGSGPSSTSSTAYGPIGVEGASFHPGSRTGYTSFTDPAGKMFLFGATNSTSGYSNDAWKYDPSTNQWAWVGGSQNPNDPGAQIAKCTNTSVNLPQAAMEIRASWADSCGFWFFGGYYQNASQDNLWYYNEYTMEFTWLSGTNIPDAPGNFGTLGVCAPTNSPPSRNGAVTWLDNTGHLWLFGGELDFGMSTTYNDLWMYTPDEACARSCTKTSHPPVVIVDCEKILIPNVFSPNGDLKNDEFQVHAECLSSYRILIYDRWGVKVFESTDILNPWNGKKNNTGALCSDGTYYYIIDYANQQLIWKNKKGFLTLLR
ncbi:MAG: kelch repeat-containing protein [Bacteroidia bacterium]